MGMRYQPQGLLRVDRSPLVSALRMAILPGVNRAYDAVVGKHPAVTGTKFVCVTNAISAGFGATHGTSSTADKIVTNLTGGFPSGGRSYHFRARRNGAGGGSLGRLFDKTNSSAGQFIYWYGASGSLAYSFYIAGNEQIVVIPGTATTAAVGEWFDLVVTHVISGTAHTINAFVNGKQVLTNTAFSGTLTDAATTPITLGNRNADNGRSWDGLIENAYIWDRILGQADAQALYENRYRLYEDSSDEDYASIAAAISYFDTQGNSYGISPVSITSRGIFATNGTSTHSATVNIPSSSIWGIVGATGGLSSAAVVAHGLPQTRPSAEGTSSSSALSEIVWETVSASQGQSAASNFVNLLLNTEGASLGTSLTQIVSFTIFDAVAESLSSSEVQVILNIVVHSVAAAMGNCTAEGMSEGGVHYTAIGENFRIHIVLSPYKISLDSSPYKVLLI